MTACELLNSCCPEDLDEEEQNLLDELVDDPALADCCLRDLQEQREVQKLKSRLLERDRSTARLKEQSRVLPHVEAQSPYQAEAHLPDEDDESDEEVTRLRMLRIEEFKRATASRRGAGLVRDIDESQLLSALEESDAAVVCHLHVEGYEVCQQLDELLSTLAYRHKQTDFIRCAVSRRSRLMAALQLVGLPALLCWRDGQVIGKAPLLQFGNPQEIYEEQVELYLGRLRMYNSGETGSSRHCNNSEDELDDGTSAPNSTDRPCELCGRTYPHEHFRAVYARQDSEDD